MTGDPGMIEPPVTWQVLLAVAYLRIIRRAMARGVIPPYWAIWLTAPYRRPPRRHKRSPNTRVPSRQRSASYGSYAR